MDNTTLDCSQFSDPTSGSFYDLLRNETHYNITLLSECRAEICLSFIGGAGNPDISGIGLYIAYVIQTGLAFVLGILTWWFEYLGKKTEGDEPERLRPLLKQGVKKMLESFYDVAVGFSFAIQLACYVIIFGDAGGVVAVGGHNELIITWLVSTASLLPLICPCLLLARVSGTTILIPIAVALFVNPFFELAQGTFAPYIAPTDSSSTDFTDAEMQAIYEVCLSAAAAQGPSAGISPTEFITFQAFAITGYGLMVILFLVLPVLVVLVHLTTITLKRGRWKIKCWREPAWVETPIRLVLEKLAGKGNGEKEKDENGKDKKLWNLKKYPFLALCIVVIPFSLSVPLLWGIYRIRQYEQLVSSASGNSDVDNTWGFGQIVAIAMYTPVLLEFLFTLILAWALVRRRLQRKGARASVGEVDQEGSNENPLMKSS